MLCDQYYVITLHHINEADSVSILGLTASSEESYNCGVTFALSIERAGNKLPCFQKLLLSRKVIENTENLREHLYIDPNLNVIKLQNEDDFKFSDFYHKQ